MMPFFIWINTEDISLIFKWSILEKIILREISQSQKEKYCMVPLP